MNKLLIEKGVPIPRRFPFEEMEVGDSFAVPKEISKDAIYGSANYYGNKYNKKFTVRRMDDGTYRCWRIK